MSEWVVTVEVAAPEAARTEAFILDLADRLGDPGICLGFHRNGLYGATFSVDAAEAGKAVLVGMEHWERESSFLGVPEWPVVRVEVADVELE